MHGQTEGALTRAQTNLQLYSQLIESGWTDRDVEFIHDIYREVVRLTYGTYRPNWKPFDSHLVGVASIVARDAADRVLVGTALAHTALTYGRFPPMVRFMGKKETYLEGRIGSEVFMMMRRYLETDLGKVTAPGYPATHSEQAIIHLKLADLLDDLIDELAPVKTGKKLFVALDDETGLENCARIAEAIGAEGLKAGFEALNSATRHRPAILEEKKSTFIFKRRL